MTPAVQTVTALAQALCGVAIIVLLVAVGSGQRWLLKAAFVLETAAFAAIGIASLIKWGAQ